MLSVPPELTLPHTRVFGLDARAAAPSRSAVMLTISASYLLALGHTSACKGLLCECSA
jgi:hypothetical protein